VSTISPEVQNGLGLRLPTQDGSTIDLAYQVLDTAPMGMAITDVEGRFIWVSQTLTELLGYEREELLKLRVEDVLFANDASVAAVAADSVFSGRVASFELEERWVRASGEPLWVLERASIGTQSQGSIGATIAGPRQLLVRQILDISHRRGAEEALEAARTELLERNRDLERSNADLAEFAYVISHDLSEPLRVISGHVQLLERNYGGSFDEKASQWVNFAVDGCTRMRQLMDDLLVYSRAGRTPPVPSAVDLNRIAGNALRDLQAAIGDSGAIVSVSPLPQVMGDASQLSQVFTNLIGNAVKFRRPGSSPTVVVKCHQLDSGWWEIRVEDDGPGVPERHRDRVFRVFQRLHAREEFPGTGIGLAVGRGHRSGRCRVLFHPAIHGGDGYPARRSERLSVD